jgi:tRNA 2-thiouridine synthesizing protein A
MSETAITPTSELDCRGLNCPLPVLKTKKALMPLASGEVLKVIATDPGSIADMAAFSRQTGHELLDQSEGGGEYTFFFRRK